MEGELPITANHVERMRAVVARTLGRRLVHEVDDVVQDALLAAHEHRHQFRGDASLSTWLHTIAVNEARGFVRQLSVDKRRPRNEPDGHGTDVDHEHAVDVRRAIRCALAQLDSKMGCTGFGAELMALLARRATYDAMAKRLGYERTTVWRRMRDTMEMLREVA